METVRFFLISDFACFIIPLFFIWVFCFFMKMKAKDLEKEFYENLKSLREKFEKENNIFKLNQIKAELEDLRNKNKSKETFINRLIYKLNKKLINLDNKIF